eukprot:tig00001177_g7368.t1
MLPGVDHPWLTGPWRENTKLRKATAQLAKLNVENNDLREELEVALSKLRRARRRIAQLERSLQSNGAGSPPRPASSEPRALSLAGSRPVAAPDPFDEDGRFTLPGSGRYHRSRCCHLRGRPEDPDRSPFRPDEIRRFPSEPFVEKAGYSPCLICHAYRPRVTPGGLFVYYSWADPSAPQGYGKEDGDVYAAPRSLLHPAPAAMPLF